MRAADTCPVVSHVHWAQTHKACNLPAVRPAAGVNHSQDQDLAGARGCPRSLRPPHALNLALDTQTANLKLHRICWCWVQLVNPSCQGFAGHSTQVSGGIVSLPQPSSTFLACSWLKVCVAACLQLPACPRRLHQHGRQGLVSGATSAWGQEPVGQLPLQQTASSLPQAASRASHLPALGACPALCGSAAGSQAERCSPAAPASVSSLEGTHPALASRRPTPAGRRS